MIPEKVIELLRIEKECVFRNSAHLCTRRCDACDLVQNDKELLEMYDAAINIISDASKTTVAEIAGWQQDIIDGKRQRELFQIRRQKNDI